METENKAIPITPAIVEATEIHYVMVLDESGSMDSIKSATIENFNSQVSELRKLQSDFPGQKYVVSLITFNGGVNYRVNEQNSESVRPLDESNYSPCGSTSLYDAIGKGITKTKETIGGDPSKRAIIIITDGDENSSHQYDHTTISSLIKESQSDGRWTFVFIGANQDSITSAKSINIPVSNAMNYSADNVGVLRMTSALNNNIRIYAMSVSSGVDVTKNFTQSEE